VRALTGSVLTLALAAGGASLQADVKTQDRSQVKFEGMLGRMVNFFGGKAAKEGVVSDVAVKGDRKATMHENGGQIVDLAEEKIYDIDTKKKTYKVTTFEELRQRMREAQERAKQEAKPEEEAAPAEPGKEYEIDFDVKETGQKKEIAGYAARQVIATVTLREKGKTLAQGGGMVMTSDMWLAPRIPAMKEITDFEMRYAQKLDVTGAAGASAEQLAAALAMYPGLQKGLARMQSEGARLDGTPLESVLVVKGVKSPEQMAQQKEEPASGGGIGGMLAKKMMRKKDQPAGAEATIMTVHHQVLSIGTTVADADIQIPAGFKQKS
jgi:hypothetical protein